MFRKTLAIKFIIILINLPLYANAENVFRIALSAAPPSKGNPFSSSGTTPRFLLTAIYDQLTDIDNNGQVIPELAVSWEAKSPTEWHFKLRPNVFFSNGESLNARTIVSMFDHIRDDAIKALYWFRESKRYPNVEVIDDMTVAFHTEFPNAMAPAYLSSLFIVPEKHLKNVGLAGLTTDPIGSGPFKLSEWQPEKIRLTASKTSWRAPKVAVLEALIVPDSFARIQALITGQVDVAVAISTDQIGMLEAAGHTVKMRNPTRLLIFTLKANDKKSPFSDIRVRKAFNYAVNKEIITNVLLAGLVAPASQPATKFAVGYDPKLKPYPYDPAKAKKLLKEAGYEDGVDFTIESPSGILPNDTAILQQIASDVAKVGMRMRVKLITYPQLVRRSTLGDMEGEGFLMDFTNRYSDALRPLLNANHACTGSGSWFCDQTIQPIIDKAEKTFDMAERISLSRQVIKYYRDVAQSLFLFPVVGIDGVHKRVKTWKPRNDRFMYHLIEVAN